MYQREDLLKDHKDYVQDAFTAIHCIASQSIPDEIEEYLQRHSHMLGAQIETKRNRLNIGMFGLDDLAFMSPILLNSGHIKAGINKPQINQLVVQQLLKNNVIHSALLSSIAEYQTHVELFTNLYRANLLENMVFGIEFIVEKYTPAIPAINVIRNDETEGCGSGFLHRVHSGEHFKSYILTNKHVIDPDRYQITSIKSKDTQYKVVGPPIISDSFDLAAVPVECDRDIVPLIIGNDPTVLDNLVSIGYPSVPLATEQTLLAHRGEVNGEITSIFKDRLLLISCLMNPGNSGGPIINNQGMVVGVATQSNESKAIDIFLPQKEDSEDSKDSEIHISKYHAAIPASSLRAFISESLQ